MDSAKGNALECARRFDPDNNPSNDPRPKKSEEISLLISTDVLAEGVNLQAGEVIINYDFHWNPTRLIQRAGRVDRIGSKNDFVTVYNFLLDPQMEKDFGLESTVDNKINDMQKIIGTDYPTLKKNEVINPDDMYAIYSGDNSLLDKEDKNPLEPSKFEQILRHIQINDQKLWEDFKNIPDGIRSSDDIKLGGHLLLACESGTEKSGRVRKYYLISPEEEIKEIRIQKALEILESDDKYVYSTPSDYDKLVSIGWKKFVEDMEQVQARAASVNLGISQRWVIEKMVKISKNKEFSDQKEMIETLRKAYSIPILKGKLNRELGKIRKSEMNDSDTINNLSQLYLHYELQNQVEQNEEERNSPRILYSKYVGVQI